MSDTVSVKYDGRPILLELEAKGLVKGQTIILVDASGMMTLTVPSQIWAFIQPGDHIFMTLSPLKVTVTPIDPEELIVPGLPGSKPS